MMVIPAWPWLSASGVYEGKKQTKEALAGLVVHTMAVLNITNERRSMSIVKRGSEGPNPVTHT